MTRKKPPPRMGHLLTSNQPHPSSILALLTYFEGRVSLLHFWFRGLISYSVGQNGNKLNTSVTLFRCIDLLDIYFPRDRSMSFLFPQPPATTFMNSFSLFMNREDNSISAPAAITSTYTLSIAWMIASTAATLTAVVPFRKIALCVPAMAP